MATEHQQDSPSAPALPAALLRHLEFAVTAEAVLGRDCAFLGRLIAHHRGLLTGSSAAASSLPSDLAECVTDLHVRHPVQFFLFINFFLPFLILFFFARAPKVAGAVLLQLLEEAQPSPKLHALVADTVLADVEMRLAVKDMSGAALALSRLHGAMATEAFARPEFAAILDRLAALSAFKPGYTALLASESISAAKVPPPPPLSLLLRGKQTKKKRNNK